MMLTQAEEGNVFDDDHVVITVNGEKGISHDGRCIGSIALGEVSKRFGDSAWGINQTLTVWILAELLEKSRYRFGELVTRRER